MVKILFFISLLSLVGGCSKQLDDTKTQDTNVAKQVTVKQALKMLHHSKVILNGMLINDKGSHLYTLRDDTGEIAVEINNSESGFPAFKLNAPVQLQGELEHKPLQANKVRVSKLISKQIILTQ